MSLSSFLLAEIERAAQRPTRRELLERLGRPARHALRPSAAELVRRERDAR